FAAVFSDNPHAAHDFAHGIAQSSMTAWLDVSPGNHTRRDLQLLSITPLKHALLRLDKNYKNPIAALFRPSFVLSRIERDDEYPLLTLQSYIFNYALQTLLKTDNQPTPINPHA